MDEVYQILLILIPSLVVFGVTYFLVNRFLERETKEKLAALRTEQDRMKEETRKSLIPNRLKAYERIILFLERINPNSMVMRMHQPGMKAQALHSEMLRSIREEYEHNMTQQMYMSDGAWDLVKSSKEETIKLLNLAYGKVNENDSAVKLSEELFHLLSQIPKLPTDIACEAVKSEVRKLFGA